MSQQPSFCCRTCSLSCTLDCHALLTVVNSVLSCTLYCHALVTVMHFLLKTEDFVQNRFLILHFWLRKKVYFEEKPSTFGGSFCCISAQFLTFSIAYSAQHCCKNTSKTLPYQSCKFGGLWTILKIFDPKVEVVRNHLCAQQ